MSTVSLSPSSTSSLSSSANSTNLEEKMVDSKRSSSKRDSTGNMKRSKSEGKGKGKVGTSKPENPILEGAEKKPLKAKRRLFPVETKEELPCLVNNAEELFEYLDTIYPNLKEPKDETEENCPFRKLRLMGKENPEEFLRFMNSPSNPLNYEECTLSEEEEEEVDPRTFFRACDFSGVNPYYNEDGDYIGPVKGKGKAKADAGEKASDGEEDSNNENDP